jgi:hypothetical protein
VGAGAARGGGQDRSHERGSLGALRRRRALGRDRAPAPGAGRQRPGPRCLLWHAGHPRGVRVARPAGKARGAFRRPGSRSAPTATSRCPRASAARWTGSSLRGTRRPT